MGFFISLRLSFPGTKVYPNLLNKDWTFIFSWIVFSGSGKKQPCFEKVKKMEDLMKTGTEPLAEQKSAPGTEKTAEEKPEILSPEEARIQEIEDALEKSGIILKEAEDRYLRSVAELDNFRKRSTRETEDFRKYANMALVQKLLPSLDNMERAMDSAEKDSEEALPIVDGLRLVLAEIMKTFSEFHVRPVEAEGKPFDPQYHMAVAQEETDDVAPGTVFQVYQKGYLMHDRLIRPSMVSVAKKKALSDENYIVSPQD